MYGMYNVMCNVAVYTFSTTYVCTDLHIYRTQAGLPYFLLLRMETLLLPICCSKLELTYS